MFQVRAPASNSTPCRMPVLASADSAIKARIPLARVTNVPVPVIVQLAGKRIALEQILAIGPGAIITFEKSCEDLLDVFVNNRLYCRGEAVRVGKTFGIKLCEVGSVQERLGAVLSQ